MDDIDQLRETPDPPVVGLTADELLVLSVHELRSPVAVIIGFAETMRDRRQQLSSSELDDALDAIGRQASRLDSLLRDILLLSADTAGALRLAPEPVALRAALLAVLAEERCVDDVPVDCDPDIEVFVDPDRLRQMITNYVVNARLHGRPPCRITAHRTPAGVEIAVLDGGDGVADLHVPRLFRRFERAGAVRSTPGTGLGLAVVRALAGASGGRAYYDPGVPGAHRFVMVLPAVP